MKPDHWKQLSVLFEAASALPPEQRAAYLDRACPDTGLRTELESLLAAAESGPTFIEHPLAARSRPAGHDDLAGMRLGPWRLTCPVGEGGMGVVWLAERADGQFEQRVAVKLMRAHLDCAEVRERFDSERRIQACLDHPGIARILDAGTTPDGRPYLVIPFVEEARPIDRYCDEHDLDRPGRLHLFRQVCAAVQHAHQNLVVHSDLKPGNILVGAGGNVQLVDFGIARLLSTGDPHGGQRRLTPGYASPEQFEGQPPTTLSDIYSLGVLLGRLLDIPRPPADDHSAPRRGDRDLRAIVDRATAAEPLQRYASAIALADDLDRWRAGFPVQARAATPSYVLSRFLLRNRWQVAGAGLALCGLVAFAVVVAVMNTRVTAQAEQAGLERDRAEAIADFLGDMFAQADPLHAAEGAMSAREMLDRGLHSLRASTTLGPRERSRILVTIARAYSAMGDYPAALDAVGEALALWADSPGASRFKAEALLQQASSQFRQGRLDEAEQSTRTALEVARDIDDPRVTAYGDALNSLGVILANTDRLQEAAETLHAAAQIRRDHPAIGPQSLGVTLHNLGDTLQRLALAGGAESEIHFDEAAYHYRQALALFQEHLGPEHPRVAFSLVSHGALLKNRGDLETAGPMLDEAIRIAEHKLGPEHPFYAVALFNHGEYLEAAGRTAQAETRYRQALERLEAAFGDDGHARVWRTHAALGRLALARGQVPAALAELNQARAMALRQDPGRGDPDHLKLEFWLGMAELAAGDAAGQTRMDSALNDGRQRLGEYHHITLAMQAEADKWIPAATAVLP